MGFRDSNQDLVGFVHQVPSRARQRIIDIASTQFPDGGCYHQYQPLTKRGNNDIGGGFNDDPCWLIFGTVAYIKETGDFSILDEMVPWDNEPGTEVPLFEHLRISFNHVIENLGPHMLPLIGRADWNDCLNLNCFSWDPNESFQTTENNSEGSKAESLMIAGLFVLTGKQYVELCDKIAKHEEAKRAQQCIDAMVEAVKKHGWDGDWYLRAYDFYGNKIGSKECEEGKIFIESQGFCTMAGIGLEDGMVEKALDSCKKYLDCEHGMVLNNPAFTRYYVEMGEISSYPAVAATMPGITTPRFALPGSRTSSCIRLSPTFTVRWWLVRMLPNLARARTHGSQVRQPGTGLLSRSTSSVSNPPTMASKSTHASRRRSKSTLYTVSCAMLRSISPSRIPMVVRAVCAPL